MASVFRGARLTLVKTDLDKTVVGLRRNRRRGLPAGNHCLSNAYVTYSSFSGRPPGRPNPSLAGFMVKSISHQMGEKSGCGKLPFGFLQKESVKGIHSDV